MKHFFKYLIIVVAIIGGACDSSDENFPSDEGKDYFPIQAGQFQIYDVVEIKYTAAVPETLKYELKIVVTDSFPNAEGGYSYVLSRSKRNDGETAFLPLDTWSARRDDREIVINEENIPFLKIKLPVKKNAEWNGNLYNNKGEDMYLMEEVKTSFTANGETFTDCIIVNQHDNQDYVVSLDQRKEIYARNIGLVFREITLLNYCTVGACLGQQQVESGVVYSQTLNAYGLE